METRPLFELTPEWKSAFPGAYAGVLAMHDVINPAHHPALEEQKEELEKQIEFYKKRYKQ